MRLKVGCDITLETSEPCPAIGMLRPSSGLAQWLAGENYHFEPHLRTVEYVDAFGNLCQRFVVPAGQLRIRVDATVDTDDQIAVDFSAPATPVDQLPTDALQFLLPSRYCPADKMVDQAQQIVGGLVPGYPQVEAVRAWIQQNVTYQYGVSNANTDAQDTLNQGAGVCRDFAHIGISMCRALRIPARMVVGYLYQLDPMDLHAWFEAFVGGRWYTFDATQIEPRGGRVVLAYGRDAADVAFISNYGPLETKNMKVWVELQDSPNLPPEPAS
jgi:transglutaminase-like putative cysteine protease